MTALPNRLRFCRCKSNTQWTRTWSWDKKFLVPSQVTHEHSTKTFRDMLQLTNYLRIYRKILTCTESVCNTWHHGIVSGNTWAGPIKWTCFHSIQGVQSFENLLSGVKLTLRDHSATSTFFHSLSVSRSSLTSSNTMQTHPTNTGHLTRLWNSVWRLGYLTAN